MGLQLIFVVEADKKCKSDWIYIKNTIERFYTYNRAHVKLSTVYMNGRGKYNSNKIKKEVEQQISQYDKIARGRKSVVIYCFDCDEYNKKHEDMEFLKSSKSFCDQNGYEFVWFCKDIESVYLGKEVPKKQKKDEATNFKSKNLIENVSEMNLSAENYRINSSNILKTLDKYIPPFRRKL